MDLEIVQSQSLLQEEVKGEKDFLLKINSLKNQKQFDSINQNSFSYFSSNIKIVSSIANSKYINFDTSSSFLFLGFKITKKIANAVLRNKLRRQIKSIIQNIVKNNQSYITANQAFIIIPKKAILQKKYQDIEEEIKIAFKFLKRRI
jgi:ribonuclease P protein component